jgi:hypothetical protein
MEMTAVLIGLVDLFIIYNRRSIVLIMCDFVMNILVNMYVRGDQF